MRNIMATAAAAALVALSIQTARADQPPPPSISVTGTGTVHYSPDIARISLGVRGESSTAAAAAKSVNTRAQAVIDALHKLGLSDANIATSGYSIEYQPPRQPDGPPEPMPAPAPNQVQTMSTVRKPLPSSGTYVATETIDVRTSIAKAGSV